MEDKMKFTVEYLEKISIQDPVLIEGLPGIGNVGKIVSDFLVESLKAKKFVQITSPYFPHSVFINEDNLIDIPVINIYHKRIRNRDFLFVSGDVQPIDEPSCYDLCEVLIDFFQGYKGKEVVTLGGIGLQKIPKKPKVYITGTEKAYVKGFSNVDNRIFGVVGPIIGVTGVLLGVAKKRKIPAAALLAQTFAHPAYIGIKGAREILRVLNDKFSLGLDLKKLSDEITEIEKEIMKSKKGREGTTYQSKPSEELNYFG